MALKLHLGCGKVILPGFVNIDIRADIDSRIVKENIFTLDSIKDNSVDLIYACHLLEHIDRHKILSVLSC
jgi:predicted SAM-dependent methyltransferase